MQALSVFLCCCLCLSVLQTVAGKAASPTAGSTASPQHDEFGEITPVAAQLVDWVTQHGGQVHIILRKTPEKGMHVIAPRAFKKGEILAEIPQEFVYTLQGGDSAGARQLWKDIQHPDSTYQTYFDSLPKRHEVWSFYDIPDTYIPLIQTPQESLEFRIRWLQEAHLPEGDPELEGVRYALSLVQTRQFGNATGTNNIFVPLLDMANHINNCTTYHHHKEVCSQQPADGSDKRCVIWYAGSDVEAGQELCVSYRFLTSDMALLQYGFLLDGPVARQLARFDRHDFDPEKPWGEPWRVAGSKVPTPFEADEPGLVSAELSRLKEVLSALKERDDQLAQAPVQPHERDAGGRFLQQMLKWRQDRRAAIELEIERLQERLKELEAEAARRAATPQHDKFGEITPECEGLVEWIKAHGGQVNVVLRKLPKHGRQTIAPRTFKKDEVLAEIPEDIVYLLKGGEAAGARLLWGDIQNPASFYRPYMKVMPNRDDVWSFYDLSDSYLNLVQSHQESVENQIRWLQEANLPEAPADKAEVEGVRYALSLIQTRQFGAASGDDNILVPLLDMANHDNHCTNYHHRVSCSKRKADGSKRYCITWYAGSEVKAGQGLCNGYRFLTSDMALLQYGFLLDGPVQQQLVRFDRHDFEPNNPWGEPWAQAGGSEPTPFAADDPALVSAELSRLKEVLSALKERDDQLAQAPVQPHERDAGGRFLQQMLKWRANRRAAVEQEIKRLQRLLQEQEQKEKDEL